MAFSPAQQRYNRRVAWLSVAYACALIGVLAWFVHARPDGALLWMAALLPALPLLGIFFALGRYLVDEQDEYLRMLTARQALIATAITLSLATVWGFYESFGLVGHIKAYYGAVVWFAGLGIGKIINVAIERRAA